MIGESASGRPRLDPEFVRGFQRRRIMGAMAREVRQEGYEHTTVADIVSTAGIARNTFYENFPNKAAVFIALLDAGFGELLAAARAGCEETAAGRRRRAAVKATLDWIAEHPDAAHCCLVSAFEGGERAVALKLAAEADLASLLDPAPAGPVTSEPLRQARCGGLTFVLARALQGGSAERVPRLLDDLAGFLDLAAA